MSLIVRDLLSRGSVRLTFPELDSHVRAILEQLERKGILKVSQNEVVLNVDKPEFIIELLKCGIILDLESLCEVVDWRVFEEIVHRILGEFQFNVFHRLRIPVSGRRLEFDIVAVRSSLILVIEVKHFRKGRLNVRQHVMQHVEKVYKLCVEGRGELLRRIGIVCLGTCTVVPVVITLREYQPNIIEGVPIVPIWKLRDFLLRLEDNLDFLQTFRL